MKTFEYQLVIKEQYLDFLGHVNNAAYLVLFEEARWDFISKNGYGHEQFVANQQGPVVLEVNLKYKKEMKLRDHVTIVSTPIDAKGKIMRMNQKMVGTDGQVYADAIFSFGFMDFIERKLISPPDIWLQAIGAK